MIGKIIAAASLLIAIGLSISQMRTKQLQIFDKWKLDHQKHYLSSTQHSYRKLVFESNVERISAHNDDSRQSYKLGLTQFADLTQQEFSLLYLTLKVSETKQPLTSEAASDNSLGVNIDWEQSKKVSPIKNQGMCGSCWAFSAVGALQSQSLIDNRSDIFSQQQLVDCSTPYGNNGCSGGWMEYAFDYVMKKGITTSAAYPYVAKNQNCSRNQGQFSITGYSLTEGCDNMLNSLARKPVTVAVDAVYWSLYKSGIFSNCSTEVNHGVLLVGVTDSYWRIKNSWDVTWGEQGYMRLARGNTCDICHYPVFPYQLYIK